MAYPQCNRPHMYICKCLSLIFCTQFIISYAWQTTSVGHEESSVTLETAIDLGFGNGSDGGGIQPPRADSTSLATANVSLSCPLDAAIYINKSKQFTWIA